MDKRVKNRGFKIGLSIMALMIAMICIVIFMIFSNSSYKATVTKVPYTMIDKVKQVATRGGILELSEEDINGLVDIYFRGSKKIKNVDVNGVDIAIKTNDIQLYIPVNYKGFNLLLSSEGQLSYKENQIRYTPLFFKVGKLNLPKNYVLEKLKQNTKNGITVENGYVSIDKSIIPIGIKSIEIKNSKINVSLEKAIISLEEKVKSLGSMLNNIENTVKDKIDNSVTNDKSGEATKENSQAKTTPSNNTEKLILDNKKSPERENALNRVNSGLNSAMGSVSTSSQRVVIGQVISVINTMKGNPSYNPYTASNSVKASYKKLSSKEKQELKSAIFSNVDMDAVNILSNMLGN